MSSRPGDLHIDVPVPIQQDKDDLLIDVPVPIQQDADDDKDDLLLARTKKWIKKMRVGLMLLAGILASLAYRSTLYPPGGFWRDDTPYGHGAGDPVLASYGSFKSFNAVAFLTSLLLVVLVSSECFYRTWDRVAGLVLIALLDLACLVGAYVVGANRTGPSLLIVLFPVTVFACFFLYFSVGWVIGMLLRFLRRLAKRRWPVTGGGTQVEIERHGAGAVGSDHLLSIPRTSQVVGIVRCYSLTLFSCSAMALRLMQYYYVVLSRCS